MFCLAVSITTSFFQLPSSGVCPAHQGLCFFHPYISIYIFLITFWMTPWDKIGPFSSPLSGAAPFLPNHGCWYCSKALCVLIEASEVSECFIFIDIVIEASRLHRVCLTGRFLGEVCCLLFGWFDFFLLFVLFVCCCCYRLLLLLQINLHPFLHS